MASLLIPGRHHLLTNFQLEYLTLVIGGHSSALVDASGRPLRLAEPVDTLLWAITSANHSGTRRNPLPAHRREAAIEDFAADLDAVSYVYHIDDVGSSDRFASYVLKKIEVDSRGRFRPRPEDTVVVTSTPCVIEQYERLGFQVLPLELADRQAQRWAAVTPWQTLELLVKAGLAGRDWRTEELFLTKVARASRRLYQKYNYGDLVLDLHRQRLTDDGGLTRTRDYNVYCRAFDEGAERKAALVKDHVVPGRIVDIGCCTGAVIRQLTLEDRFRESDFYGVEIAHELHSRCENRKEERYFGNDSVFFYHANAVEQELFPPNSINTFLTFSLTHEIESYQGRAALQRLLALLQHQLALGGRWLNVDVVGPEQKDEMVYLWLNNSDGRNHDYQAVFADAEREQRRNYLAGLSTFGRFLRFRDDYRHDESYRLACGIETIAGQTYARLRLLDACEFLSKKDYLNNWVSEMHETFCFWSLHDWKRAVEAAGFHVHADSRTFTNPWIVENRYRGKVGLFRRAGQSLEPLDFPPTTMLLIAEKR